MNGLRKDQILVIAGILFVILLSGLYTYFTFFDTGSSTENLSFSSKKKLPEVPKTEKERYETRLEQTEAMRKEKEKKERLNKAKSTIDLDVFDIDDEKSDQAAKIETRPSSPEPVKRSTVKQQSVVKRSETTAKKTRPSQKTEIEKKEVTKDDYIDPDLMFADNSFTDQGSAITPTEPAKTVAKNYTIPAVVQDQVTVTDGSRVTLRTTEEVKINGKVIPRNTYIHSTVRFNRNRVFLTVPQLKAKDGSFLSLNFNVYDAADNQEGLYSKELIESDLAKDQTSNLANEVANNVNNGLIRSAIRSTSNQKIKEQKITIYRNQSVYLKNAK